MTFYGPTFPNESHDETLLSGRQRFGSRSANMFFVRPARHIACPRRLKYIHDIKTGYIPYVEDSSYPNVPSYRQVIQKGYDDDMNKNNGLGLYNAADSWRGELIDLAQQVKSTLISVDDQEQPRSSRLSKHSQKRSESSVSNYHPEENDEKKVSKRLLKRRASASYRRSQVTKSKSPIEKPEPEHSASNENQDSGIWLIPILCYVLQVDNLFEAQDWLVNANSTEKRLAMELISRTMQDMQSCDNDLVSDVSTFEQSTTSSNLNNVYWPYKVLQRQEKDRHQQQEKDRHQQQVQQLLKQSRSTSHPSLPSLNIDNSDRCERATSPLRMLTPGKRLQIANNGFIPAETIVIERSPTRNITDRATPAVVVRQNQTPLTARPTTEKDRPSPRVATTTSPTDHNRPSRRGYRVATSLNNYADHNINQTSPTQRGKTPLI